MLTICLALFWGLGVQMLEWVAIPFSRGSSQLRDQTLASCIAGRFFTIWATRKPTDMSKIDLRRIPLIRNENCVYEHAFKREYVNGWMKQPLIKFLLCVRPGALRGGRLRWKKWWAKRLEDRCIREWEWTRKYWARKQWEQVLKCSSGRLCLIDQGLWIRAENWNIYLGWAGNINKWRPDVRENRGVRTKAARKLIYLLTLPRSSSVLPLLFFFNYCWSRIDLQCNFCCIAKWVSYMHSHTHCVLDSFLT